MFRALALVLLASLTVPAFADDKAQTQKQLEAARDDVAELKKLLDDDETEIAVSVGETKVRFATPTITLTSKVIDGTFPDYTRVIPRANARRLEVDAADFARAVDRVATSKGFRILRVARAR